jgi:hypothetical protein
MIATFFISKVATFPSGLSFSSGSATGVTQYSPSGEIGG